MLQMRTAFEYRSQKGDTSARMWVWFIRTPGLRNRDVQIITKVSQQHAASTFRADIRCSNIMIIVYNVRLLSNYVSINPCWQALLTQNIHTFWSFLKMYDKWSVFFGTDHILIIPHNMGLRTNFPHKYSPISYNLSLVTTSSETEILSMWARWPSIPTAGPITGTSKTYFNQSILSRAQLLTLVTQNTFWSFIRMWVWWPVLLI
jgi:hypothetical protein